MELQTIIDSFFEGKSSERSEEFIKFLSEKMWNEFNSYLMDKVLMIKNEVNAITFNLPNAKENTPYDCTVSVPSDNQYHSDINHQHISSDYYRVLYVSEQAYAYPVQ